MVKRTSLVLFTVPEFALLVHRKVETIRCLLRDGKLKGIQRHKGCLYRISESELEKFWGRRYGSSGKGGGK